MLKHTTIFPMGSRSLDQQRSYLEDIVNDLSVVIVVIGESYYEIVETYDYYADNPYYGTRIDVVWITDFDLFKEFFNDDDLQRFQILDIDKLLVLAFSPIKNKVSDMISIDEVGIGQIDYKRLKLAINEAIKQDF